MVRSVGIITTNQQEKQNESSFDIPLCSLGRGGKQKPLKNPLRSFTSKSNSHSFTKTPFVFSCSPLSLSSIWTPNTRNPMFEDPRCFWWNFIYWPTRKKTILISVVYKNYIQYIQVKYFLRQISNSENKKYI